MINALVQTNPTELDPKSQGDDHLRGIKKTIVDSFGNYSKRIITSVVGALNLPSGTTAQRESTEVGALRYNTDLRTFEGNGLDGWGSVGSGQMLGTTPTKAIFYNSNTISENLTVDQNRNGLTAGPVTINNGITVTVDPNSVWTVV